MATRLGIIGAGIMGERMIRAALDHAARVVEIGPVWDASSAALDRLAAIVPVRAASAAEVIARSDCVYVATPPGTHLAYADQALSAGRAVFLEKPLATDMREARAFARRREGAPVAVNFPFASSFAVEQLQAWIAAGTAGPSPTLAIDVAFRTWPRTWQHDAAAWLDTPAEGGFTREVVSHFLFLAARLCGPLHLEHATVEPGPAGASERNITATLTARPASSPTGTPQAMPVALTGSVGTTDADDHNTWTLTPTTPGAAAIRLRDWSFAERQAPDGTWHGTGNDLPNAEMRPLVLRRQLEAVDRMTRGEPHRLATVPEALAVQAIVEAILSPPGHA